MQNHTSTEAVRAAEIVQRQLRRVFRLVLRLRLRHNGRFRPALYRSGHHRTLYAYRRGSLLRLCLIQNSSFSIRNPPCSIHNSSF